MDEWSAEELENAFMWDLIHKSEYDDERHRRGFGAGPNIARLEELSQHLAERQSSSALPAPFCIQCGKPGHSHMVQRIVYASLGRTDKTLDRLDGDGKIIWSCPECAGRTCSVCGSPHQLLMGLDMIDDHGVISHTAIFPVDPGCINPDCKKHRSAVQTQ